MSGARVMVRRVDALLAQAPTAATWLSESEQERAARRRAPQRHAQYLAGHWLLRTLLAQAFGGDPSEHALIERHNLPPVAQGAALCLSLSHGGDFVAAALSSTPIGIDLETRGPRPALHRLQHLLREPEEPVDSLDEDALLQRWVLKEAWIKRAHGSALPETLAALHLRPAPVGPAELRLHIADEWLLAVASGMIAAVDAQVPTRASLWRCLERSGASPELS
ncbi:MAG: hypothetical protein AMXMBFR25_31760 [Lysobacterales bacterium]